jgi:putative transposase
VLHSLEVKRKTFHHRESARWRPPGRPHFGEIVERVIGTLMAVVHALRGATFSNVDNATIRQRLNGMPHPEELEDWLAVLKIAGKIEL